MRLAIDTGGTFTDLVLEDLDGTLHVFKRPTTPEDPAIGILDVIDAAAASRGLTRVELLERTETFVHATTYALNALLTDATAKTALLTTAGHRDILLLREGGREHFNVRADFPDPYVPRYLTFEVVERITASGAVRTPLDLSAAVSVIRMMRAEDIEAVAVTLLWSVVNPSHELALADLLDRELPSVPYTLSHRLNPSLREFRRASATAIDASLKPLMGHYLSSLSDRLRHSGFVGRLLMVTSAGTLLDIEEVAAAPIHSIKSGPAMAPVAGRHFVESELDASTAIVTDTGGTSYDVSAVREGTIPWSRDTWLGKPFLSSMTGFPSVDVRSYGAGGGSIAWVDHGGLLHVGPKSAGADPGPVAYGRGGQSPTFTDAAIVLGHIDPEDFLGGQMLLDPEAAEAALLRDVGIPLGLDATRAAGAVARVMSEQMARAIEDTALRQGVDPSSATLVAGGGAAGLNAVVVASLVGCRNVLVPPVSAALSAAGAVVSDLGKDFLVTHPMRTSRFDYSEAIEILSRLSDHANAFVDDFNFEGMLRGVDFFIEAHYVREVWEIEVPIDVPLASVGDVLRLKERFHKRHDELYAVTDTEADLEIVSWRARAWCQLPRAGARRAHPYDDVPLPTATSTREAYFAEHGWLPTSTCELGHMKPGQRLDGPAIVTSPVTTTVVNPGASAEMQPGGSLLITLSSRGEPDRGLLPTGPCGSSA
jgi:N-methylhydantoinase A